MTRSLLDIARGVKAKRGRGLSSNVRIGASFEDAVEAVLMRVGHVARGNPGSKVVTAGGRQKVVYTKKNGVDFVGVVFGRPIGIECKRLPKAASLTPSKDDSTQHEARWLLAYRNRGGCAGFLVYDPEADEGHGRVYAVADESLPVLAVGRRVTLRHRNGDRRLPSWDVRRMSEHSIPTGLTGAIECAVRFLTRQED